VRGWNGWRTVGGVRGFNPEESGCRGGGRVEGQWVGEEAEGGYRKRKKMRERVRRRDAGSDRGRVWGIISGGATFLQKAKP